MSCWMNRSLFPQSLCRRRTSSTSSWSIKQVLWGGEVVLLCRPISELQLTQGLGLWLQVNAGVPPWPLRPTASSSPTMCPMERWAHLRRSWPVWTSSSRTWWSCQGSTWWRGRAERCGRTVWRRSVKETAADLLEFSRKPWCFLSLIPVAFKYMPIWCTHASTTKYQYTFTFTMKRYLFLIRGAYINLHFHTPEAEAEEQQCLVKLTELMFRSRWLTGPQQLLHSDKCLHFTPLLDNFTECNLQFALLSSFPRCCSVVCTAACSAVCS